METRIEKILMVREKSKYEHGNSVFLRISIVAKNTPNNPEIGRKNFPAKGGIEPATLHLPTTQHKNHTSIHLSIKRKNQI